MYTILSSLFHHYSFFPRTIYFPPRLAIVYFVIGLVADYITRSLWYHTKKEFFFVFFLTGRSMETEGKNKFDKKTCVNKGIRSTPIPPSKFPFVVTLGEVEEQSGGTTQSNIYI